MEKHFTFVKHFCFFVISTLGLFLWCDEIVRFVEVVSILRTTAEVNKKDGIRALVHDHVDSSDRVLRGNSEPLPDVVARRTVSQSL